MDDPTYKGGVYQPKDMPLRDYFSTYVGGPTCKTSNRATCANNETKESIDHYESETVARINRYLGSNPSPPLPSGGTSYAVAGLTVPIALSFPLKQMIVSASMTQNRPGIRMTPDRWVQHETDNTNPGAGAHMHANYLANGAEGRQASWHFTVDDTEAWQSIPVNEVSWQGGDGAGPCNMKGVSCELCVNMLGNPQRMAKARRNAEELCAQIMKAMHLSVIEGHTDCCARQGNPAGCHSGCPKYMMADGYWPQKFKSGVASFRNS
jgi:N-acetylmuramoyl-L-alanine amidase